MKTNEERIEEFKKEFVKDNGPEINPSFKDPNGDAYLATQWILEALEAKDKETVRAVEIATRNMEEAHREEMNKLVESVPKIFVPIDSCGKIEDINQEWREYKLNLLKSNE